MINCILILSIIIYCVNAVYSIDASLNEQDNSTLCNELDNIISFTFSTQINYCEKKGENKSECVLIEENVINGTRGRLILKYANESIQIYYKNDFPEEVVIADDLSYKYQRVHKTDSKYFKIAPLYLKNKRKIIGPTALVIDAIKSKDGQFSYEKYSDYGIGRGIEAYSCKKTGNFTNFENSILHIIFEDPKWSSKKKILKIKLEPNFGTLEFNYFKLINENESIWSMPAIGASLRDLKNLLPNFHGTGIHEISLEKVKNNQIEKIDLYYDSHAKLLRVDNMNTNELSFYDAKARSIYKIKNGICDLKILKKRTPTDIRYILELLDEIEQSDSVKYNFIGQEMVQDIICDLFETTEFDSEIGLKTIKTIHVRHKISNEDDTSSFPLRVTQIIYKKLDDQTTYKMESKIVYNILNYQQIYYDEYYREVFQTKYCHSDQKDNLYLTMIAKCDNFTEETITTRQHIEQFKSEINNHLRNITNLSYLQIPELFIEFHSNEVKIEFILEDTIRLTDYFQNFSNFWIPTQLQDEPVYFDDEQHCQRKSLSNSKYYGFTYCTQSDRCFMIDEKDLFIDDHHKERALNEKDCFIKQKLIDNGELSLELIHDAYLKLKNEIDVGDVQIKSKVFDSKNVMIFKVNTIYETYRLDNLNRLNNRLPFLKQFTKQRLAIDKIEQSSRVRTVKDCYLSCREKENCNYFNLCSDGLEYVCELSNQTTQNEQTSTLNHLEFDNKCNVFALKNLNLFDKHERQRFDTSMIQLKVSLDVCATKCLNYEDNKCKSITFCGQDQCELTDHHKESHLNRINSDDSCSIYSINYLEDFHQISLKPVAKTTKSSTSTIKQCALDCIQSNRTVSFNFCPDQKNREHLGKCSCTQKDDPIPDHHELSWECVTMQRNLNSFFNLNSILARKSIPSDQSTVDQNRLTFWPIVKIVSFIFFIGILLGIGMMIVNERIHFIPKLPVNKKEFSFKIRFFNKQKTEDDEDHLIEFN